MHSRRHFLHRAAAVSLGFVGLRQALARAAGSLPEPAPGFGPLRADPAGIIDLPAKFRYQVISRAGDRMDDGLIVPGRHDGMSAFPGPDGMTIIVRNHEIEPAHRTVSPFGADGELLDRVDKGRLYDAGRWGAPSRGGTTTLVYDTRGGAEPGRLVRHSMSLAGTERNCAGGPTPRNTWISCEESVLRAGGAAAKDHGYCFEVPASAQIGLVDPRPIRAMGRFYHEACATNPFTGAVYMTEDRSDGVLYRYLPETPDDLHAGGRLQALAVVDRPRLDLRNWEEATVSVGDKLPCAWIDLEDVDSPDDSLRHQATDRSAATFARGEGMWYGRGAAYIASTDGGCARMGQIWRYIPAPPDVEGRDAERSITGHLELFHESPSAGVIQNADNITVAPWGDIICCEDGCENPGDQYLVGITPGGEVYRLGRNALNGSELAGATFSPDGTTLFINLQIPGLTLAIRGPWRR